MSASTSVAARWSGISFVSLWLSALGQPPPAHAAVEVTPMISLGKPTGDGADSFNPGLGAAVGLGGRFSELFSVAAELGLDRLNLDAEIPDNTDVSFLLFRLQVVPALHLVRDKFDLAFGPSLGFFHLRAHVDAGPLESTATARGMNLGARLNLFIAVNPSIAVGPFFAYTRLFATKTCQEQAGIDACDDDPENDDEGFWNLGVAARF